MRNKLKVLKYKCLSLITIIITIIYKNTNISNIIELLKVIGLYNFYI